MSKHNNALLACVWMTNNLNTYFFFGTDKKDPIPLCTFYQIQIYYEYYDAKIQSGNFHQRLLKSSLIFRFIYTGVMTPWPSWPRFDTYHLSVHCNTAFVSSFPLFIKEREKVLRNCSKLNHVQKAEKNICFHKKKKKDHFRVYQTQI